MYGPGSGGGSSGGYSGGGGGYGGRGGGRDSGGGDGGGGGRGRGDGPRQFTPRGQMSGGANQRPPLTDLAPGMKLMFEPRAPIEYKPTYLKKSNPPYTGCAQYAELFEKTPPQATTPCEPPAVRKERLRENVSSFYLADLYR
jgi:hypothetical protein